MGRSTNFIAIALAGTLAGCGQNGAGPSSGSATVDTPAQVVAAQASAALTRAGSCDDLLSRIQQDVSAKIVLEAELMKQGDQTTGVGANPGMGIARGVPGTAPTSFANGTGPAQVGTAAPAPAAGAPAKGAADTSGASGGTGTASSTPSTTQGTGIANLGPDGHSDTNVQVKGVDEADIVKTDGSRIYLLHGNQLFVLKSWPATETAIEGKLGIEGSALEMFVEKNTAVVFSSVYDQGDLIDAPPPVTNGAASLAPNYYGSPFTKITLLDVTDATPKVTRELLIEGNYLSARRYDSTVRAVIQGGFRTPPIYAGNIDYQDPWGRKYPQDQIDEQADAWRDRMIAAIMETKLEDWLPSEREVVAGKLTPPARRCTDFYAPAPGLTDYGLSNIVSFNMQDPKSPLGGAIVLGAADEVYSNESVMLLAHRDYRFDQGLIERERTVLHSFALKGAMTTYTASGFVPGHIVDQFSLDEQAGVIRAATTAHLWQDFKAPFPMLAATAAKEDAIPNDSNGVATLRRQTDNRVLTLRSKGTQLVRAGMTEPLGDDGETLQSTRFVGDRGYVVTFHKTDPLMIIDLSKPEALQKLGELDIPGFSDYMHPLDDNNLLTIGRDTDPTTGADLGLMLQTFDVSDATKPRRTHTYKFGPNGYSEANVNHKAFTFYKPDAAVPYDGVLAFPYVNYSSQFQSALEVLTVSAKDGFVLLGSVDHTKLLQNVCGFVSSGIGGAPAYFNQCVQPEVRRGLFIFDDTGDFVYSISNGGVLAHSLTDLVSAVATVPLPLPDYSDHRICYGATDVCANGGIGKSGGGVTGTGVATPGTSTTPPTPAPTPAEPALPPAMGSAGAGAGL